MSTQRLSDAQIAAKLSAILRRMSTEERRALEAFVEGGAAEDVKVLLSLLARKYGV